MADYKIGHSHTGAAYDGDNPLRLAKEIDATLDKYGLGNKHHLFKSIKFFEDELRPIATVCAARDRRRSQSSRAAVLTAWPRRKGTGDLVVPRAPGLLGALRVCAASGGTAPTELLPSSQKRSIRNQRWGQAIVESRVVEASQHRCHRRRW
jgi:hypothetical protein